MTLLGLPFHEIGEDKLHLLARNAFAERTGLWLNLVTQEHLQAIENDRELRHALIAADVLLPESWLLVSACRQLFHSPLTLYSAPVLLAAAVAEGPPGFRSTLLIPQNDSIERMAEWWAQQFPRARAPDILGVPTDIWIGNQGPSFLEAIIATRPDLLALFLPTPLQEKWINGYRRYLAAPLILGLGPSVEMAPAAIIPGRTQERLRHSKSQLLKRISDQTQRLAVHPRLEPRVAAVPLRDNLNSRWTEMAVESRFDAAQVETLGKPLVALMTNGASLLLDLSRVQFIDSSALGLLITLLKTAEHFDRQLVLIRPTKVVTDALRLVQLDQMFDTALDAEAARIKGDLMARNGHIRFERGPEPNAARIFWRGRVHSVNWEKFWRDTLQVMDDVKKLSSAPRDMRFQLDLSQVTFIDSLGVGLLLRLTKWAKEQFIFLNLINPSRPVVEVIDLAQLQNPLLQNTLPQRPVYRALPPRS